MTGLGVDRPERRGSLLLILALVAFLGLPLVPTGLRSIIPIQETAVLLLAALAACVVLGWWRGGGVWLAAICVGAGVSIVWRTGLAAQPYGMLVCGWTLLLIAAFGVASLVTPSQGFFVRGLSAVGLAIAGAFALAFVIPDGVENVQQTMTAEYTRRTEHTIAQMEELLNLSRWHQVVEKNPKLEERLRENEEMFRQNEAQLREMPEQSAKVLPALIALESLAGLALAWTLYHRVSRTPLGPPLGALRDFRFNDQLIWGLAVGATIFFLPPFAEGKGAGLNLLVFFGTLYLLRGMGVLSWVARGRGAAIILITLTAFIPLVVGALAFGVGVGDTWMDWRSRVPSARS